MKSPISRIAIMIVAMLGLSAAAYAQVDSESPGVARLSMLRGDVSMQRGDSGDTSAVELNTPLVAGDKVFTGSRSRAEVQLDWADILRLDENAEASIATLDQNHIQVQLAQGLTYFSVLDGSDVNVEIDTPNVAVTPRRGGGYRIEITSSGDTVVTVREGEADISTPQGGTILRQGEAITVRGMGEDARYNTSRAPYTDEFDRWNSDRDQVIQSAESYRRTNRYYTGAADLDSYGHWDNTDDYGYVWVPRVAVGWAPYRQGRWVWTAYWGWTWTSYEPWGWAPYHYGRWFVHRGSWVWWPGPVTRVYRPVYAPAYVSFFGFGGRGGGGVNVGVSFGGGFGSIGWLPVGPCDYVNPWWGSHRGSYNVVNITNVTNIYNVRNPYAIAPLRRGERESNLHNLSLDNNVRSGLSAVAAENFGHGRGGIHTASANEFRDARFMTGNVPVVPSRDSLRVSDRPAVAAASRTQNDSRFFSRRVPSDRRESFADESGRLRTSFGNNAIENGFRGNDRPDRPASEANRFGGNGDRNSDRPNVQSERQAPQSAADGANSQGERGAWRRFGTDSRQSPPPETAQNRGSEQRAQPPDGGNAQRNSPRPFTQATPRSQRVAPNGNPEAQGQSPAESGNQQRGWQRFSDAPRDGNSFRSGGDNSNDARPAPRSDSRPEIELNRPIVRPRSFAGSERPAPSGNAEQPSFRMRSAPPSGGGSRAGSAPAPRGNAGGGGNSPRGSGSRARAGGHGR